MRANEFSVDNCGLLHLKGGKFCACNKANKRKNL